jgi:HEAT repeat protein
MGTKRRILITSLPVMVLGALVWFLLFPHGPPEPVYQGRPLRVWLEDYCRANENLHMMEFYFGKGRIPGRKSREYDEKSNRAEKAIQHMGTNAIPTLLKMIRERPFVFREKMARLLKRDSLLGGNQPERDHELAVLGFRILGGVARPAVPDMIKLLEDKDLNVRIYAIDCLAYIGSDAEASLPALIRSAQQTNIEIIQGSATRALGEIHSRPELVLPVLMQNLAITNSASGLDSIRRYSLLALGRFGPEAKVAVPAILPCLNDPDREVKRQAVLTLNEIDPQALVKIGIGPE